jgi:hypothetical protein
MLRLAALIPLALVACVDSGDEGLYVVNNSAVTGTSCVLNGSPMQPQLGHGLIQVDSPLPYIMTPLLQSRITAAENVDDISKTIQLRGADVTLTLKAVSIERNGAFTTTNPETQLTQFSTLFSGSIAPGASVNAFVDIIPPATIRSVVSMSGANLDTDSLNAEVLASVVIKGEINDNGIESQPYLYPVTLCDDCVFINRGLCVDFMGTASTGNACNQFQDGVVDCCTHSVNGYTCPAVPET